MMLVENQYVRFTAVFAVCFLLAGCSPPNANSTSPGQIAPQEWTSLFDGKSMAGWTATDNNPVGSQWQVIGGDMVLTAAGGGDIVTVDTFADFELKLEWKISEKGNSGIFYRVASDGDWVWKTGIEYQILDDQSFPQLAGSSRISGSVFDLYGPSLSAFRPSGEFNQSRIRVENGHVEHWLNGSKILSYHLWSDDWIARFRSSKFVTFEGFAKTESGHIALQDHGDRVWFRNIQVREL